MMAVCRFAAAAVALLSAVAPGSCLATPSRSPRTAPSRASPSVVSRSTALRAGASLLASSVVLGATPSPAPAKVSVPDFVKDQMGANADRPFDVGGGGRRNGRSGYLNQCPSKRAGRGCVSTFDDPYDSSYVPPWTYAPSEEARAAAAKRGQEVATKSIDSAMGELVTVLRAQPDATVVEARDRYVLAEFRDPNFGFVDDVEFLFSSDTPGLVGYRSAARVKGGDDKRHRNRIKALRVALQPNGWTSVGRLNM